MKVTPSDCLHQEYLTINLGSTSDGRQLKLPLVRLFGRWRGRCWPAGAAWGRECRRRSSVLPLNLSDTAATSQDGSSLEFIAPIAGRQCYLLDASGRGLCTKSELSLSMGGLMNGKKICFLPFPITQEINKQPTALCHLHPEYSTAYPRWLR